jgi:hypothetical protein
MKHIDGWLLGEFGLARLRLQSYLLKYLQTLGCALIFLPSVLKVQRKLC